MTPKGYGILHRVFLGCAASGFLAFAATSYGMADGSVHPTQWPLLVMDAAFTAFAVNRAQHYKRKAVPPAIEPPKPEPYKAIAVGAGLDTCQVCGIDDLEDLAKMDVKLERTEPILGQQVVPWGDGRAHWYCAELVAPPPKSHVLRVQEEPTPESWVLSDAIALAYPYLHGGPAGHLPGTRPNTCERCRPPKPPAETGSLLSFAHGGRIGHRPGTAPSTRPECLPRISRWQGYNFTDPEQDDWVGLDFTLEQAYAYRNALRESMSDGTREAHAQAITARAYEKGWSTYRTSKFLRRYLEQP